MSDNLPKVRALIHNACPNWYDLGLELGVKEVTLQIIKSDCNSEVEPCFREMLSAWLKMTNPRPTWEGMLAALEWPYIKCEELADQVREDQGIPKPQDAAKAEGASEMHVKGWTPIT